MKIDVLPVYSKLPNSHLSSITVIVVDVLRTTTNIVLAVQNGAGTVLPTNDPADAVLFRNRLGMDNSILAGEIDGLKINGFDIGNSPSEFGATTVRGKNVILSANDGTATICGVSGAKTVLIGAMINCEAVAKKALELGDDILIICAGTNGKISADDLCGAGAIAAAVTANAPAEALELTDITKICTLLYTSWRNNYIDLTTSASYAQLIEQGFAEDARVALEQNTSDLAPKYENGIIQAL